jgi:hypothetical protein
MATAKAIQAAEPLPEERRHWKCSFGHRYWFILRWNHLPTSLNDTNASSNASIQILTSKTEFIFYLDTTGNNCMQYIIHESPKCEYGKLSGENIQKLIEKIITYNDILSMFSVLHVIIKENYLPPSLYDDFIVLFKYAPFYDELRTKISINDIVKQEKYYQTSYDIDFKIDDIDVNITWSYIPVSCRHSTKKGSSRIEFYKNEMKISLSDFNTNEINISKTIYANSCKHSDFIEKKGCGLYSESTDFIGVINLVKFHECLQKVIGDKAPSCIVDELMSLVETLKFAKVEHQDITVKLFK